MGRNHARALARGTAFRLVSIVDPVEPDWADVHWECDLDATLARLHPDAVIVAVPSGVHDRVARQCLAAGCHVLLEKPLCPSEAQASRLAESFRAAGRILFGGHCERFHPVFRALVDRVDPASVEWLCAVRTGPHPQRAQPDDVLLDLAIHDVDLAIRLLGPLARRALPVLVEGLEGVGFRAACGADVAIRCGYQPGRTRHWEIRTPQIAYHADFLGRTLESIQDGRRESLRVGEGDALELEHRAFRRALEGRDSSLDLAIQIESIGLLEEPIEATDQSAR